jgi:hypothetical protein
VAPHGRTSGAQFHRLVPIRCARLPPAGIPAGRSSAHRSYPRVCVTATHGGDTTKHSSLCLVRLSLRPPVAHSPGNVRLCVCVYVLRGFRLPRHCEGVALPEQAFNRGHQRYRRQARMQGRPTRSVRPDKGRPTGFPMAFDNHVALPPRSVPKSPGEPGTTPLLRAPRPSIPRATGHPPLARGAVGQMRSWPNRRTVDPIPAKAPHTRNSVEVIDVEGERCSGALLRS